MKYRSVKEINWTTWIPEQRVTLLFIIQNNQILLIHKKRGFGKGKINGPGGKIENGETPKQCAIREVEEELCITPTQITFAGKLYFQFIDGFSIEGDVFTATHFTGTPTETEEAIPIWFPLNNIPFEKMWEDDHTWFPYMLNKQLFSGRYLFDEDRMIDAELFLNENAKKI